MKFILIEKGHNEFPAGHVFSVKPILGGLLAIGCALAVLTSVYAQTIDGQNPATSGDPQMVLKSDVRFYIVSMNEIFDKDSPDFGMGHVDIFRGSDGVEIRMRGGSRNSVAEVAAYVSATLRDAKQVIDRRPEVASDTSVGERILAVSTSTKESGREYILIVTHGKRFSQISSTSLLDVLVLDDILKTKQADSR
jgi:hypothetical protein